MINNNLDFEKQSNSNATNTNANANPNANVTSTITTHNRNSNSRSHISPHTNTNDNSYFNRFDNRIAANLAAVLTGSRFRSSSCSKSTRSNANGGFSNSTANLHMGHVTVAAAPRQPPNHLQLNNGSNGSRPGSPMLGSIGRRRQPLHLFAQANLNCNDNEKVVQTPSSDEDNSPTELNNCKRLADKPPLVKRLTMGLLRGNEESRPLMHNAMPVIHCTNDRSSCSGSGSSSNSTNNTSNQVYSNGYVNEEAFEPAKFIASKFGDSCRQSLTAIPMLDTLNLNDNSEFNLKKRYLRETSSANSSPKIFANRLRLNTTNGRQYSATNGSNSNTNINSNTITNINLNTNAYLDDDEVELKDASWFQAGISRDIAVEVLSSKSPGAFLVRKSSSKPGCYALTLRVPSPPGPKIANYIILRTARGYKIKGFRKEFSTLKALITHHSVMPELLPVPLAMPRPTNMTSSRRNLDDFDTYDSLQMLLKYLRAKNLENE